MEDRDYSEEVAQLIDAEVRSIVERNFDRATEVLSNNRDALERLVARLMERECIERDEFLEIMSEAKRPSDEEVPMIAEGAAAEN